MRKYAEWGVQLKCALGILINFLKTALHITRRRFFDEALTKYKTDKKVERVYQAAAKVEAQGYCKWTRVQESLEFAKLYGAKRIGIAACVGLMSEATLMSKLFENHAFEVLSACCKTGSFDKKQAGIAEEDKIRPGQFEAICNPIAQAEMCNKYETDLNFIMGLCVGHDSLFIMYSKAPVSYIVVKDRVTGHNPRSSLPNSKHILQKALSGLVAIKSHPSKKSEKNFEDFLAPIRISKCRHAYKL